MFKLVSSTVYRGIDMHWFDMAGYYYNKTWCVLSVSPFPQNLNSGRQRPGSTIAAKGVDDKLTPDIVMVVVLVAPSDMFG